MDRACVGHFYFLGAASQHYAKKQKTQTQLWMMKNTAPLPPAVIAPLVDSQPHPTLSAPTSGQSYAPPPLRDKYLILMTEYLSSDIYFFLWW